MTKQNDGTPIYWLLFWHCPQALQDLNDYQRKHYGFNIDKPEQPKQEPLGIYIEDSEGLERLMRTAPMPKGQGGY